MKARLTHSVAAAVAAGVLLTSCSSDSGSDEDPEPIDGVASSDAQGDGGASQGQGEGGTSPSPSPSDDGIDRPVIELPDDMNNVFEDTETGDPVKDAIIQDTMARIQVTDMAFAAGDPSLEEMAFYATGEALVSDRQFVRGSAEDGLTWAGTVVYYDFTVDNEGDRANRPVVGYCEDISELRDKNLETGELAPLPEDATFFLHTQAVVRKNDQGVWQAERVLPDSDELDRECER